jgi:hypothetical protein
MSDRDTSPQSTQHAFLVAWGRFAAEMGLIEAIPGVKLKQKKYRHVPQTKLKMPWAFASWASSARCK